MSDYRNPDNSLKTKKIIRFKGFDQQKIQKEAAEKEISTRQAIFNKFGQWGLNVWDRIRRKNENKS